MRIALTPEQSTLWAAGGTAAWQIEQDYLEMAESQDIDEPVVVVLDDGQLAFAFYLEQGGEA